MTYRFGVLWLHPERHSCRLVEADLGGGRCSVRSMVPWAWPMRTYPSFSTTSPNKKATIEVMARTATSDGGARAQDRHRWEHQRERGTMNGLSSILLYPLALNTWPLDRLEKQFISIHIAFSSTRLTIVFGMPLRTTIEQILRVTKATCPHCSRPQFVRH